MDAAIPKISLKSNQNEISSSEDEYESSNTNMYKFGPGNNDVDDVNSKVYKNAKNHCKKQNVEDDLTDVEYFNSDVEYLEEKNINKRLDLKLSLHEFLQCRQKEYIKTNNELHGKGGIKNENFLLAQSGKCNDCLTDCEEYNTDSDIENNCEKSACLDITDYMKELVKQQMHDNEKNIVNFDSNSEIEQDRLSFISDVTDLGAVLPDAVEGIGWNVSQDEYLARGDEEKITISTGNESATQIPLIDVTFVADTNMQKYSLLSTKASNLLHLKDTPEELLTDIEHLYDSEIDDENSETPISHGVIIPSDDEYFCETEVEQIQTDIENQENDLEYMEDLHIKNIPPSHREIIKFKENNFGDSITEIMPMNDNILFGVYYAYKDDCNTDTEELSGTDECNSWTSSDLSLPTLAVNLVDNEVIFSNERLKNCTKIRTYTDANIESATDIEEIYLVRSARRKKFKARNVPKNQMSKLKYLEVDMVKDNESFVEELSSGDRLSVKNYSGKVTNNSALSSDEDIQSLRYDKTNPMTFSSISESLKNNAWKKKGREHTLLLKAENIDVQQLTDVEDFSMLSDECNSSAKFCDSNIDHNLLIDSHTVVKEKPSNNFNTDIEKLHMKGVTELRDAHTDTEYVELDDRTVQN